MQLPAVATLQEAAALAATLPAAVAAGTGVLHIDASPLRSVDSSTLALLLQARRLAQAAGRTVVVEGAPPKLQQLAQLYGLDGLLPLSPLSPLSAAPASSASALPSRSARSDTA
jgi:phospholipid transport system transporter-binding protein